jgi:hypothetical protein
VTRRARYIARHAKNSYRTAIEKLGKNYHLWTWDKMDETIKMMDLNETGFESVDWEYDFRGNLSTYL